MSRRYYADAILGVGGLLDGARLEIAMGSVEIRPIELPRDAAAFVKSWWAIYEGDPMWVPPLIGERKAFFDPGKNPYHQHADIQCFMAYRDGKPVGTISAQIDKLYLDKYRNATLKSGYSSSGMKTSVMIVRRSRKISLSSLRMSRASRPVLPPKSFLLASRGMNEVNPAG